MERARELKTVVADAEAGRTSSTRSYRTCCWASRPACGHVPDGSSDDDASVRVSGEPVDFDFTARDHVELGETLGILDLPR